MKKITKILLMMTLVCAFLVGCGNTGNDNDVDTSNDNVDVVVDDTTENIVENTVDSTENLFELFSHEGFTLSTDKVFIEDESGIWFSIWVNNGTDKKLVVTENCVSVNLYMVDVDGLFAEVEAGTQTKMDVLILKESLERVQIEEIGQLDIWFRAYDRDTFDDFYNFDRITIETEAAEGMDALDLGTGIQIYNNNDIIVYANKIVKEEGAAWLELYVENNTNDYIVANPKNVTINGSETDVLIYADVRPLRMTVDNMKFYIDSYVTEGANEVAFDLQVYIKEPEMSIIETVPVSFTIE